MWVSQPRIHKTDHYVFNMGMRLWEAAEPTNTRASATRATPTQPGFAQPHSSPRPAFSSTCRLPASTHGAAQPPRRRQPQLARAPAGHRSPTGSRGFRPLVRHPPPLEPPRPRTRVRAGSAVPTDALKSCSTAACPPPSRPGKRAISRRSPPPTSSTCSTATQRSLLPVMLRARWAGVLRTPPHRPQPA